MIVIVCGLSGSGKSSLIDKTDLASLGFDQVKASDILRAEGRPTKGLRASDVLENQNCIVRYLTKSLASVEHLLLDGHLLIETVDGPQLVPDASLATLPLAGIAVVKTGPEIVSLRRNRTASDKGVAEIFDLMQIEEIHARRIARQREIPYLELISEQTDALLSALKRYL